MLLASVSALSASGSSPGQTKQHVDRAVAASTGNRRGPHSQLTPPDRTPLRDSLTRGCRVNGRGLGKLGGVSRLISNPVAVLIGVFCLILLLELIFGGHVQVVPALSGGAGAALVSTASKIGEKYRASRRSSR